MHCWYLRGSDKEEQEPARWAPAGLPAAESARRAHRTFWELQRGQGVQKGVPADKTEVAGEDQVAERLLGQCGPNCRPKRSLGKSGP